MSFMDSLAANPSGSIYGQGQQPQQDALGIVNQLKDREMRDFQTKANFMSDLSLKQDRLKALFDPSNPNQDTLGTRGISAMANSQPGVRQSSGITPGMSQRDPNAMTAHETADIGIKQQGLGLEKQKMEQAGKMGEERLGIQSAQEKLNAKKEGDIRDSAQAKLEAKIEEANGKLTQAQAALQQRGLTAEAALEAHKNLAAAVEERHKLEMAQGKAKLDQQQSQFEELQKQHEELIKQRKEPKTTRTSINPEGTEKTTTTTTGQDESDPLGIR